MDTFTKMETNSFSDKEEYEIRSSKSTDCGSNRNRAKLFLVVIISFVIAAIIVLIVVVTRAERPDSNSSIGGDEDACTDVSIIGAGLAGSYISWKFRNSSKKVHLYEMRERLGGRLLDTNFMPYINETIPVLSNFINPERDTRLNSLINEFGLKINKLTERKVFYYLRNHLKSEKNRNNGNLPYFFDEDEKGLSPESLQKYYIEQILGHSLNISNVSSLCLLKETDRKVLLSSDFSNGLEGYASSEGINCLLDTLGVNAPNPTSSLGYLGEYLAREFTDSHQLDKADNLAELLVKDFKKLSTFYSHKLEQIEKKGDIFRLKFTLTANENGQLKKQKLSFASCTKRLILSTPKSSIEDIEWKGIKDDKLFKETMNSLKTREITTIHLIFNETIWSDKFSWITTDLPLQRISQIPFIRSFNMPVLDHINSKENSSSSHLNNNSTTAPPSGNYQTPQPVQSDEKLYLLSIDSHEKFFTYWESLKTDDELLNHIKIHLSRIFSVDRNAIPDPLYMRRATSGSKFPFYSNKYLWNKKVDWCHIRKAMFRPVSHEQIFIVNDSFDTVQNQQSLETLLKNADDVLETYFSDFLT
ncbi:DgyrCDS4045 [Dimorphilus gyrociliatus]|uniref:DgyrCDS4045 n=1 Tax=Dimorphilus gyrociliatus TaxID=2664684 RepID=A0A7I8VHW1_9ANNE|nr:DgyrCDS4045 [Dimorphilus gyrociliatus]